MTSMTLFYRGARLIRAADHTNHHFDGSNQALAVLITASDRSRFAVLRSLTGLGCSSCSTSVRLNGAECNHPTAFAGPPLLAGNDQFHCD
jgi:hypothetical protein